jgi:hypothetical protein
VALGVVVVTQQTAVGAVVALVDTEHLLEHLVAVLLLSRN